MALTFNLVLYPVGDLAAAKTFYTELLGAAPTVDEPYYVQYSLDGQDVGLVPTGSQQDMTGPVVYFTVADIARSVADLEAAGGTVSRPVSGVGGGLLVAVVNDADGNPTGLRQMP